MQLNRIPKMVSYKERVYHELKQAIMKNELKPGALLNERTLAADLGISRTPVREALQWLERDGWVETEPCRGTWVREITVADVEELYQMRSALEPLTVELVVQRLDGELAADLKRRAAELAVLDSRMDHRSFVGLDAEFHLHLARLSGNRLLYQAMGGLMDMMAMYVIQAMILKTDPYDIPLREHEAILRAILRKDAALAKTAMLSHIRRARAAATENMGTNEED